MKKFIKHIWRYLTSPTYSFWIDFCSRQENIDKAMNEIIHNLRMTSYPIWYVKGNKIRKLKQNSYYNKPCGIYLFAYSTHKAGWADRQIS